MYVCGVSLDVSKVLLEQGDPQTRVFLITQGSVSRLRYLNEQLHHVETVGGENHRWVALSSRCKRKNKSSVVHSANEKILVF